MIIFSPQPPSPMSYPPPIYPLVPNDAFLEGTVATNDVLSKTETELSNKSLPNLTGDDDDDASTSVYHPEITTANNDLTTLSLLAFSSERCSTLPAQPSPSTWISLKDSRLSPAEEPNHKPSPSLVGLLHSARELSVSFEDGSRVLSPILSTVDLPIIDDSPIISPVASPMLSSSQPPLEQNILLLSVLNPIIPASTQITNVLELSPLQAFQTPSPPSSSPAKIFSSTPLASSQSSFHTPSSKDSSKNIYVEHQDILDLENATPSSSPARIFSSSPFPSSQSSFCASSDEPNKLCPPHDTPFVHQYTPVTDLEDADSAHTPQSSPDISLPSSPVFPSSSPQEAFPRSLFAPLSTSQHIQSDSDVPDEIMFDLDHLAEAPRAGDSPFTQSRAHDRSESGSPNPFVVAINENAEASPSKRTKPPTTAILPPVPKRLTFASQKLQYKKLATPFRSPLMKKNISAESNTPILNTQQSSPPFPTSFLNTEPFEQTLPHLPSITPPLLKKKFTSKSASQFKSPLSGPALATSGSLSAVRLTPAVQALERKIQILKQAVRLKTDGEEDALEILVKKWTDAGREVASEVWELIKDSGGESTDKSRARDGGGWGEEKGVRKRGFEEGWGWGDKDAKKLKTDEFERNWGWNVERNEDREEGAPDDYVDNDCDADPKHSMQMEDEQEDEKMQDTLGTMLRQLGIAPETFGWDEDEGEFV